MPLPAITRSASGPDLDAPRNKEFVAAFRQKYGYYPSYYAAQSFDAIAMIDHAVKAVNGDIANTQGMIAALEKADFPSVRGKFKYNKNHFPIEDFYLLRIGKDRGRKFHPHDREEGVRRTCRFLRRSVQHETLSPPAPRLTHRKTASITRA